jgi:hypothetical protein
MAAIESDEEMSKLIEYLRDNTPLSALNAVEARAVFRSLSQLGYRIQKPAAHPSGLQTTEQAITRVSTNLHSLRYRKAGSVA